jgi:hypothetical protein
MILNVCKEPKKKEIVKHIDLNQKKIFFIVDEISFD